MSGTEESFSLVVYIGAACHGVHGGRGESRSRGRALGLGVSAEGNGDHTELFQAIEGCSSHGMKLRTFSHIALAAVSA